MKAIKIIVILLLVMIMLTACMSSNKNEVLLQKDSLERSLTIELVTSYAWEGNRLNERITQFAADRPDIDITIRRNNNHYLNASPWILGRKGVGDQPDIVELTPNQLKTFEGHRNMLCPLCI